MKNYTYGWKLENMGYTELPENDFTDSMFEMKEFINDMSMVIKNANCGWDGVWYKVMECRGGHSEYMVLHIDGHGERWIPISGNSKGANFSVLGENLW